VVPTTASIVATVTNPVSALNIAALRLIPIAGLPNGMTAQVAGYYAAADGGGGPTRVLLTGQPPGTYTDNGGSIIVPTGGNGSAAWLWQSTAVIDAPLVWSCLWCHQRCSGEGCNFRDNFRGWNPTSHSPVFLRLYYRSR